ncbi:hypothetical protein LJB99_06085, partial [Deltaproteobacteria bacterium OttesenSCG-928-K17]|nr:hypothetical protein [Deltaproteobacteria bacterium OttesenSCG-928-K17]
MKAFTLVLLCLDVLALVVATLVFAVWTLYPGGVLSLYLLLPIPLIAFAGYFWFQTTFKSIDWFTRHGAKDRRPLFASAALASYIGVIALICLVKAAFLGLYFLLSAPAGDAFFQPYQGAFGLP